MKTFTKAIAGTLAAGALAAGSATPALAGDRYDRDHDGISAGEVIAGAVVIGGLAAILSSANRDRDYRYNDRNYRDRDYRYNDSRYRDRDYRSNNRNYRYNGYDYRGNGARSAVDMCVRTAERQARRWTGTDAKVYQIRDVDRERGGYEVEGRIAVRDGYRRGFRSYRNRGDGWDEGKFKCEVRYGRVVDLDYDGIRSL